MEKILTAILDEIKGLKQGQDELKEDVKSTRHTVEVIYNQTAELTEFRTETKEKLDIVIENQKSLYEMYGEHEVEIRNLRRRPV